MKRLLIVSFDILRPHDPRPSYSIATLLAYARSDPLAIRGDLSVEHAAFDLAERKGLDPEAAADRLQAAHDLPSVHFLAVAVYAWSEPLVLALMPALRRRGFVGEYVLGGYQITATPSKHLRAHYPEGRYFLKGYAEESLLRVVREHPDCPAVLEDRPDFSRLPSIYLERTIPLDPDLPIDMLRWETKRGCPYRCGFCEWRNAANKHVFYFPMDRLQAELDLFRRHEIRKINVLDATFNYGKHYLEIAREMADMNCTFAVQARFETLARSEGREFLELCSGGNIHLELGLQTVVPEEMEAIGRKNNLRQVREGMALLNELGVHYEISLIFGIPGQTLESFVESVNFVLRNGCTAIQCFPLRIPRGSTLEETVRAQCVREKELPDNFGIAQVVQSFSFSERDWHRMGSIAERLRNRKDGSFLVQRKEGLSWTICRVCPELRLGRRADGSDATTCSPAALIAATEPCYCEIEGELHPITVRTVGRDAVVWLRGRRSRPRIRQY